MQPLHVSSITGRYDQIPTGSDPRTEMFASELAMAAKHPRAVRTDTCSSQGVTYDRHQAYPAAQNMHDLVVKAPNRTITNSDADLVRAESIADDADLVANDANSGNTDPAPKLQARLVLHEAAGWLGTTPLEGDDDAQKVEAVRQSALNAVRQAESRILDCRI